MNVVGQTEAGQPVVAGVFALYDTSGLPFSIILDDLRRRGMVVSLPHLYREAREAGWKHKTIVAKLIEAYADAMGATAVRAVEAALEMLDGLYNALEE